MKVLSLTGKMAAGPLLFPWKEENAKPFYGKTRKEVQELLKKALYEQQQGTHLNPTRDILNQLQEFLRKAGLPHIRFHDLRHSVATVLLSLETSPKIVQEVLGHSAISVTMDIYSHVLPTMQKETTNRLHEALQGQENDDCPGHIEMKSDEHVSIRYLRKSPRALSSILSSTAI